MRDLEHLRRRYADHVPGLLGARHSYAVLCPLVERPDGLHLLFEVRSAALHRQPGEVCFPGGRMEAGETPEQCALRETEEELAIPRQEVEILGRPDFICNQAGFLMQPVLGLVSAAGFAAGAPPPPGGGGGAPPFRQESSEVRSPPPAAQSSRTGSAPARRLKTGKGLAFSFENRSFHTASIRLRAGWRTRSCS